MILNVVLASSVSTLVGFLTTIATFVLVTTAALSAGVAGAMLLHLPLALWRLAVLVRTRLVASAERGARRERPRERKGGDLSWVGGEGRLPVIIVTPPCSV
ncbi:hypothetical protein K488DRAFT_72885 [Vararia minispora EC-137]|uniref:Uncharacterized protein n=1 Tax=Vararia minispora EC-137 TaxID=1314806 RepID=A0ACB8QD30_9AGAM|nr:hypothetical protein K488DRAFT_72885 [Vararia minispora EC-137]